MKKLLLILAFFPLVLFAQNYPTVNIWGIENDTVTLGDSLYIGFKFLPPSNSNNTCGFQLWNQSTTSMPYLWQGDYNYFYTLPKYHLNTWGVGDSVSKIYVHIPQVFPIGACRIYSTGGTPAYVNIYVLPPLSTGVNENVMIKSIKEIQYFDLIGKKVNKPTQDTNGIIIVQTIYTDGSRRTEKKYYKSNL